jgi:hypothetical protein
MLLGILSYHTSTHDILSNNISDYSDLYCGGTPRVYLPDDSL